MAKLRIFKSLKFKRLIKLITSRAFIGSIIFSVALWAYTSLNGEYKAIIDIPISVKLPENRAVEIPLPPTISIKVRGTGWHLFNLIFFNSSASCLIDLSKEEFPTGNYIITRNDILKGIQYLINVEPLDVLIESHNLETGPVGSYKVPVRAKLNIIPKAGFIALKDYIVEPDSVTITGLDKVVRKIKEWLTEPIQVKNIYESRILTVPLSDTLDRVVHLSTTEVNIHLDVQQIAEVTFHDIPLKIRGGALPRNHKILPNNLTVTVRGGVEQLTQMSPDEISSYIDYSEIMNDSTGIIVPKVHSYNSAQILNYNPPFVYHLIQTGRLSY